MSDSIFYVSLTANVQTLVEASVPIGSQALGVSVIKDDVPEVTVWLRGNRGEAMQKKMFAVVLTHSKLPDGQWRYIGTGVFLKGEHAVHVFEKTSDIITH